MSNLSSYEDVKVDDLPKKLSSKNEKPLKLKKSGSTTIPSMYAVSMNMAIDHHKMKAKREKQDSKNDSLTLEDFLKEEIGEEDSWDENDNIDYTEFNLLVALKEIKKV